MKVLFVCAGNTCRSPIAAGLAMSWARRRRLAIEVRTAGISPHRGRRVAGNAVVVMGERGVDISNEYSKPVTADDIEWADAIVPLQRSHAEHLVELYEEATLKIRELPSDIFDPYLQPIAKYRECRNELEDHLPSVLAAIAKDQKKLRR